MKWYAQKLDDPASASHSWALPALCEAYGFPKGTLTGGIIDIVELGGAFDVADVEAFCSKNGFPVPTIETFGTPQPDPNGADVEVALDIQNALGAYSYCTGKPAHIRVRFLPNAAGSIAQGIIDATTAGSDTVSISWGEDERDTGVSSCQQLEMAALDATAKGTAVFAASGDNGSSDGGAGANVDSPSSCPHVIACGGTHKLPAAEKAWSGTGGGYSDVFQPMPAWQIGAHPGPGRMVPDVSAVAAPATGYEIVVAGKWEVVGGTSGVAPLWAGFIAAIGQKLGFIAPALYSSPAALVEIVKGDNGQFRAGPYPSPVCGLGVPDGAKVAALKL